MLISSFHKVCDHNAKEKETILSSFLTWHMLQREERTEGVYESKRSCQ